MPLKRKKQIPWAIPPRLRQQTRHIITQFTWTARRNPFKGGVPDVGVASFEVAVSAADGIFVRLGLVRFSRAGAVLALRADERVSTMFKDGR